MEDCCEALIKRVCGRRDKLLEDLVSKESEVREFWEKTIRDLDSHVHMVTHSNVDDTQSKVSKQEFDTILDNFTNLVSTFYRKVRILEIKVS